MGDKLGLAEDCADGALDAGEVMGDELGTLNTRTWPALPPLSSLEGEPMATDLPSEDNNATEIL